MKTLCSILAALLLGPTMSQDGLLLMFWNLENFFDCRDGGGGDSDREFTPAGDRHWTRRRFDAKCNAVAKTILWMEGSQGALPDVVGVAEVENSLVLRRLVEDTALRKLDYRWVHFESPDPRGIDVALLYRGTRLRLVDSRPCRVGASVDGRQSFRTRDILAATFVTGGGDSLCVLVNHHPSKYGGSESSERRIAALQRLREVSDSLSAEGWGRQVAMGDFNDTPDNPAFSSLMPSLHFCPGVLDSRQGSIRFNGLWQLIDLAFVTPPLLGNATFRVCPVPFLTTVDSAHSGLKPLRTYVGPRYAGGVSDHYPIIVKCRVSCVQH